MDTLRPTPGFRLVMTALLGALVGYTACYLLGFVVAGLQNLVSITAATALGGYIALITTARAHVELKGPLAAAGVGLAAAMGAQALTNQPLLAVLTFAVAIVFVGCVFGLG